MNAIEVSRRYLDAWNRHDADAIVAIYAEGGTYHTPRLDHVLKGQAIADWAESVWAAYPDMRLEESQRPPVKPEAWGCEPLKAAVVVCRS